MRFAVEHVIELWKCFTIDRSSMQNILQYNTIHYYYIFQLSKLCHRLDELSTENEGNVILFMWTDFLQNDTFLFLNLTSPLDLSNILSRNPSQPCSESVCDRCEQSNKHDERAIQDIAAQRLLRPTVLEFDKQEKQREFERTPFTCYVCFVDKPGSQCIEFATCAHVYCKKCMGDYFTVQIQEGNVSSLTCPSDQCESQALPSQVRTMGNYILLFVFLSWVFHQAN